MIFKVRYERAIVENTTAYDKRQAGRDDNYWCGAASAAAHIEQAIRSLPVETENTP